MVRAIALFGCEFFLSYGMTECCGKISMSILPDGAPQRMPGGWRRGWQGAVQPQALPLEGWGLGGGQAGATNSSTSLASLSTVLSTVDHSAHMLLNNMPTSARTCSGGAAVAGDHQRPAL